MIRKFIDHKDNPLMRPSASFGSKSRRVEKVASMNIKNYLIDQNDEGIDDEGNTTIHHLIKSDDQAQFEA